jgi:hypothetical protein
MRGGDIAAQRAVHLTLIERVVPVGVGRGKYDVEIAWTPLDEGLRAAVAVRPELTNRTAA